MGEGHANIEIIVAILAASQVTDAYSCTLHRLTAQEQVLDQENWLQSGSNT